MGTVIAGGTESVDSGRVDGRKVGTERVCDVCGGTYLGKGRQRYCGPVCADKRLQEQLAAAAARKKVERRGGQPKPCKSCNIEFIPKHPNIKYCCEGCRKLGLEAAVEEQRKRRKLAKSQEE